ncbi:MAG TPA: EamA/RhaT family transporter [Rhodobacteraceae bacterium]|nr:EamA/RhaT family transporter [Paracoccaceae bacterium]
MDAWIPVTLAAASAQTVRFMLQKHLKSTRLSTMGATFSRFIYSAPLVAFILVGYLWSTGQAWPATSARFWGFALAGGLAQILATLCVVALFAERNFAVGITLKKTEVLQAAILGFLVLGEAVTLPAAGAILLGFVAVLFLSEGAAETGQVTRGHGFFNRAIGLGLLSGVLFAFSGIGYRGATLAIESNSAVLRAGVTLALVTASQSLAMGTWLLWRDRAQLAAVLRAWRVAGLVGVASMIGSFCWFLAFTLQTVAYVKALGQVELVLSVLASVLFFRERVTVRELGGIALLLVSILVLVLVT